MLTDDQLYVHWAVVTEALVRDEPMRRAHIDMVQQQALDRAGPGSTLTRTRLWWVDLGEDVDTGQPLGRGVGILAYARGAVRTTHDCGRTDGTHTMDCWTTVWWWRRDQWTPDAGSVAANRVGPPPEGNTGVQHVGSDEGGTT